MKKVLVWLFLRPALTLLKMATWIAEKSFAPKVVRSPRGPYLTEKRKAQLLRKMRKMDQERVMHRLQARLPKRKGRKWTQLQKEQQSARKKKMYAERRANGETWGGCGFVKKPVQKSFSSLPTPVGPVPHVEAGV